MAARLYESRIGHCTKPHTLGASKPPTLMITSTWYKIFLLALAFFVSNISFSQKATRRYIDSVLLQKDTTFGLKQRMMYVLNGVPYDSIVLDSELAKFEVKQLLDVIYWNGKMNGQYPFYGDAVIIVFAYPKSTKSKRQAWRSAKKLFTDPTKTTVLLIDNTIIDPTIAITTFRQTRIKDILYIDRIELVDEIRIRIWKLP